MSNPNSSITILTDQEKSVTLARAMGLEVSTVLINPIESGFGGEEPRYCDVIFYKDDEGYVHETQDIYDPERVDLARRALLWGHASVPGFRLWLETYSIAALIEDGGFRQALDMLMSEIGLEIMREQK